jgi:hypothetical protein
MQNQFKVKTNTIDFCFIFTQGYTTAKHNIVPNRSSFEIGTAEFGFARDSTIPSKETVNRLFNDMLVKYLFIRAPLTCGI